MGLKFTEELSNEVMTTFKNGNINDSINIINKAMNSGIPFISGSPRSSVSRDVTKFANLMITDKEERN